jgi:hypothetical protein
LAWAQAAETGRSLSSTVDGHEVAGWVLDIDGTIAICHSDKQPAAKTRNKPYGFHPLLCFLDASGEGLAGLLRPDNAGSNIAADHVRVLDLALTQLPDHLRRGEPILIRSNSAGPATRSLPLGYRVYHSRRP